MTSAVNPVKTRNTRKLTEKELNEMRRKDHQMVRGVFRCFEPRGGSFTFSFKKYKGDQILKYTLADGDIREVPLMVAKHLNQNCWYPVHSHALDAQGNPTVGVGKKVQRCSFESLEFLEEEEKPEEKIKKAS